MRCIADAGASPSEGDLSSTRSKSPGQWGGGAQICKSRANPRSSPIGTSGRRSFCIGVIPLAWCSNSRSDLMKMKSAGHVTGGKHEEAVACRVHLGSFCQKSCFRLYLRFSSMSERPGSGARAPAVRSGTAGQAPPPRWSMAGGEATVRCPQSGARFGRCAPPVQTPTRTWSRR